MIFNIFFHSEFLNILFFVLQRIDPNNDHLTKTNKNSRKLSIGSINVLSSSCSSDDGNDSDDEEEYGDETGKNDEHATSLTSENISILNSTGNKIIDSSSRNDFDSNESANSTFTSVDSKNLMTNNKRKKVKRSNKVRAKSQDYFTRVMFFLFYF